MSLFRTILYPTDLSACAEAARPLAFELARHGEALHLLYVDSLFGSVEYARSVRHDLARLGAEAPVPVETDVARDTTPATAILRYAERYEVDLIVMGTHGRRGIRRLLLGSTAREVVQLAPCSVLTVCPDTEAAALPMLQGGSLLVAVDFSETSREALRQAAHLAEVLAARLDLVHVVEEVARPVDYGLAPRSAYELDAEERTAAALHTFREEVTADLQVAGADEVVAGPPAKAITEVAQRLGSSLIVLGTKGLRGLEHLVMGSTAEKVVRTAPCPVLTVKVPGAATAAREAIQAAATPSPTDALPRHIKPHPVA